MVYVVPPVSPRSPFPKSQIHSLGATLPAVMEVNVTSNGTVPLHGVDVQGSHVFSLHSSAVKSTRIC